jgi:hypothetical protein
MKGSGRRGIKRRRTRKIALLKSKLPVKRQKKRRSSKRKIKKKTQKKRVNKNNNLLFE